MISKNIIFNELKSNWSITDFASKDIKIPLNKIDNIDFDDAVLEINN